MNVPANANNSSLPIRAHSLSTLIARAPELKRTGTGLGYSCLMPWGTYIATPAFGTPSTTPDLDEEVGAVVRRWARDLHQIGLPALVMTMNFDDEPAAPEGTALTRLDAAALYESMAAAMHGSDLDPTWATCIVSLGRRQPGAPIEAASVLTAPQCDEQAAAKLTSAVNRWLLPRRSWYASLQQLYFDVNAADYWAAAADELGIAGDGDAELMRMPAAGTA